ncbi:MAG: MazG nucleotide pyrophosphohydrolase domain-containing protein [Tatlockia sp.]|jgi:uncharacterized protein YabN with tetrapyrrole methylase and pyrophosphatase domain
MHLLKKIEQLENEATEFGFQWEKVEQVMEQIQSECLEIKAHLNTDNRADLQEEIGDLMHAVFSLCVFCQLDTEETLQKTVSKFERRLSEVKKIAREQGLTNLKGLPFDKLMLVWNAAKKRIG